MRLRSSFFLGGVGLTVLVFGAIFWQVFFGKADLHAAASEPGASKWSEGWYEGVEGYKAAYEEFEQTGKPMGIYMSVGWCPYCRTFEKGILSSPAVKEFLKDKIMVNINPESGPRENALASHYRVTGFPTFYAHVPRTNRVVRLYTGGTPREFIKEFEEATK